MATRRIVPLGGGGFSMEPRNPRLDLWLLSLTRRPRPRVLFVPTATGDSKDYIRRFYKAYDRLPCEPQHLQLFNRTAADIREPILASDLIFVGGGNTANLLAVWRLHGVDRAMTEAWENGTVLAGVSAGAICWFEGGVTDSFGQTLQPLTNALALLPGSFCPHYDNEPARRPAFHRLIAEGALPPGHAADDGTAILFEHTTIADIVRSRPTVAAYHVTQHEARAHETRLDARLLPR